MSDIVSTTSKLRNWHNLLKGHYGGPCFICDAVAALETLTAIGGDNYEGKRIEEAVAHAVGRDTAKCALAALRHALEVSV
jgi:hypothetical protein